MSESSIAENSIRSGAKQKDWDWIINISKTTSFLIPSARGVKDINDTIESILNTCSDRGYVEILIKVDTLEEKKVYDDSFFLHDYHGFVKVFFDDITGYENSYQFVNYLAAQSKGELLWALADDVRIRTSNWQPQFEAICKKYPDMLFAINHRKHVYSWVPVITRRWFDIVGYWADGCFGDTWIQHVAHCLGRYIQVSKPIQIDHNHDNRHHSIRHKREKRERIFRNSKIVAERLRQIIKQEKQGE